MNKKTRKGKTRVFTKEPSRISNGHRTIAIMRGEEEVIKSNYTPSIKHSRPFYKKYGGLIENDEEKEQ